MIGVQWEGADYDKYSKERLEFGFYGARNGTDMASCEFFMSDNDGASHPDYGNSTSLFQLAYLNGSPGNVKDLVDNAKWLEDALPGTMKQGASIPDEGIVKAM